MGEDSRACLIELNSSKVPTDGATALIAEGTLAVEMAALASDLKMTIHPHPTLSETFNFAAEMAEGTITDLYIPRRK